MVAILFKCTYNRYRKLTVWHSASSFWRWDRANRKFMEYVRLLLTKTLRGWLRLSLYWTTQCSYQSRFCGRTGGPTRQTRLLRRRRYRYRTAWTIGSVDRASCSKWHATDRRSPISMRSWSTTQRSRSILWTPTFSSHLLLAEVISSFPGTEVRTRSWSRHSPSALWKTLLMASGQQPIYIFCDLSTMTQRGQYLWKSPIIMNRNLWLKQSTATVATDTSAPLWNLESVGQETCDSWEPYKALLHVDKLHNYLRANAMKSLIPSEHK